MQNIQNNIDLSVVIPIFNEEENIPKLIDALNKVLKTLNKSYEVIFVDDGSTDNSFKVLKDLIPNPNFKIISFRRNFGQTTAISAGFDHSRGKVIVTMDGDLQNDPEDIPKLLAKIDARKQK